MKDMTSSRVINFNFCKKLIMVTEISFKIFILIYYIRFLKNIKKVTENVFLIFDFTRTVLSNVTVDTVF